MFNLYWEQNQGFSQSLKSETFLVMVEPHMWIAIYILYTCAIPKTTAMISLSMTNCV